MENLKQKIAIGFGAICIIGYLSFMYYHLFYTPPVKIGDVWRWSYGDSDNPYKNIDITNYQVVAVNNGYVKCLELRDSTISIFEQHFFKNFDLISRGGAIIIYLPHKK